MHRPSCVDSLFDGVRVAWLTIIACILFLPDQPMSRTFLIGKKARKSACGLFP